MALRVFSASDVSDLVERALASPRLRQHMNIHADFNDPCQRTFIAIRPGSYVRPHRHALVPRDETMIAIRGVMALVIFDEEGRVTEVCRFGADAGQFELPVGVDTPRGHWHTLVALSADAVLLEIKAGPFDPTQPREFADWAPEERTREADLYLQGLLRDIESFAGGQ